MATGRKPVPSIVKLIRGNPGGRKIDLDAELKISGEIERPEELTGDAKTEWDRIIAMLGGIELLTPADRALLAQYCTLWARWLEAERHVKKEGAVIEGPNHTPMKNPWLTISTKCVDQLRQLAAEFGFSPSARTRVKVAPQKQKTELDELLG